MADFSYEFSLNNRVGNQITYAADHDGSMTIRVTGTDLAYNAQGELVAGTVNKISFAYGGDVYAVAKGLSLDAVFIENAIETGGSWAMIPASEGNDTVTGSKDHDHVFGGDGNDRLEGYAGRDIMDGAYGDDRLFGGKGADTFKFRSQENGFDKIIDFDAAGGPGRQDMIDLGGAAYEKSAHEMGTLISFDDVDAILLIGVKPRQIDDTDFVM